MHRKTRAVTDYGPELQQLVADMFATMEAARGVGLAATQIGVDQAVFVYDCPDEDEVNQVGVVCNPVVELPPLAERRLAAENEGCLSYPGASIDLARADYAVCRGTDATGAPVEVIGTGILARCLQHETDHLNGIVFGDRLSKRVRRKLDQRRALAADYYPDDWPVSPATLPEDSDLDE